MIGKLGLALALSAFIFSASESHSEVRFGIAAEPNPPFSYKGPSGKWQGWEIDLMNSVCLQMNTQCELIDLAWDGLIPSLLSKNIDVIWSSMGITPKREQTIDFTVMYYDTATVIAGPKNGDRDISPEHLKDKKIGVQSGTTHEAYVKKYFAVGSDIVTYQTQDDVYSDLAAGRLDYVQSDASSLDAFLKSDEGRVCCEIKGPVPGDPAILGKGVGGGVRKEDKELKEQLNRAITTLAESGAFVELTNKYPDLKPHIILP